MTNIIKIDPNSNFIQEFLKSKLSSIKNKLSNESATIQVNNDINEINLDFPWNTIEVEEKYDQSKSNPFIQVNNHEDKEEKKQLQIDNHNIIISDENENPIQQELNHKEEMEMEQEVEEALLHLNHFPAINQKQNEKEKRKKRKKKIR